VTKVSFALLQTPHKLNQLFSIMLFHARRGGPCLPVFGKWVYSSPHADRGDFRYQTPYTGRELRITALFSRR